MIQLQVSILHGIECALARVASTLSHLSSSNPFDLSSGQSCELSIKQTRKQNCEISTNTSQHKHNTNVQIYTCIIHIETWHAYVHNLHTFIHRNKCIYTENTPHTRHACRHTLVQTNIHAIINVHHYIQQRCGQHTWIKSRTSSSSANLLPAAKVNNHTQGTIAMPRCMKRLTFDEQ